MLHGKLLLTAAALLVLSTAPFDYAQGRPFDSPPNGSGEWRNAPEYVSLFTPVRASTGAYHAYVSRFDLPTVLRQMEGDSSLLRPPGAWLPVALLPSDAF